MDYQVSGRRGGDNSLNRGRVTQPAQYGGKSLRPMPEQFSSSSEDEAMDDEVDDEEIDFDNADPSMFVKDKADQEYLDSLNEMEREKILADRFEEKKREVAMRNALNQSK